MPCSHCRQSGHNIRTCPSASSKPKPAPPRPRAESESESESEPGEKEGEEEEESGAEEGESSSDEDKLSSRFGQMRVGRISAKASREVTTKGRSKNHSAIHSVDELNKILAGPHKHVVVLFTATDCGACASFEARWTEYQQDYPHVHFVELVFQLRGTKQSHEHVLGLHNVRSVPAVRMCKNGQLINVERHALPDILKKMAHSTKQVAPAQTSCETNVNEEFYPMKRKPRGLCVVINNMHFDGDVRKGSEHDERSLREVFEGLLHFKVEVYKDLTAADMELTLLRAARKNHSDYDAFACVILSHGSTKGVSGVDSRSLDLNSCLRFFNSYNCPTLHNKPKLFFVQACRGGGKDGKGAAAAAAASAYRRGAESDGDDCDEADGDAEEDAASKFKELPATETADFLLAFSTPFGYVSWRDVSKGSRFIQTLCAELAHSRYSLPLQNMLTTVRREVMKAEDSRGFVQVIDVDDRLTHTLKFA